MIIIVMFERNGRVDYLFQWKINVPLISPAFALHEDFAFVTQENRPNKGVVTTQPYVLGIYDLFLAIPFFFPTNENKYSGHYHM